MMLFISASCLLIINERDEPPARPLLSPVKALCMCLVSQLSNFPFSPLSSLAVFPFLPLFSDVGSAFCVPSCHQPAPCPSPRHPHPHHTAPVLPRACQFRSAAGKQRAEPDPKRAGCAVGGSERWAGASLCRPRRAGRPWCAAPSRTCEVHVGTLGNR